MDSTFHVRTENKYYNYQIDKDMDDDFILHILLRFILKLNILLYLHLLSAEFYSQEYLDWLYTSLTRYE